MDPSSPPSPHLPMFEADSQNFAPAPSVPRGFELQNFSARLRRGRRRRVPAKPAPLPLHTPPPPFLICSLGHEGHRLAPAVQRAGARALRVWLQAPQQVHQPAPPPHARCWAPEGGSCRGAHQRMSRRRRGSACCRRQCWGGGIGRHELALSPTTMSHCAGGPLLGLGHLFPTLPGTPAPTTHGDMGGEGGGQGGGSVTVRATGEQPQWLRPHVSWGAVVAGTPAGCVVGHDITGPPSSSHGHVPRRGQGARTGAHEPCGRFWLHLGRAH